MLPICANLGSAGVVFWVRADVYFLRHDGKICGLRISRFERAFADQRSRITKATPYPELAVASEWPSVVLGPLDQVGTRDVSSWDVELTLSADLVAEEAPLEQERTSGKDSEAASSSD